MLLPGVSGNIVSSQQGKRCAVVRCARRAYELARRFGISPGRVYDRAIRSFQTEVDVSGGRTQKNYVYGYVSLCQNKRNAVLCPEYQVPAWIQHCARVLDSSLDLQEVFSQREGLILSNRSGYNQIAAVTLRDRV